MHDPMTVAFDIPRPWPHISRPRHELRRAKHLTWFRRHPPRFYLGPWEISFPTMITVWHVEPNGGDSSPPCRDPHWRRHVRHWQLQVPALQELRRRVLTRCEWCGGRNKKGDRVDVSHQWDGPRGVWWRGEPGLFHRECSAIWRAHRTCLCDLPMLDHGDYGRCVACSGHRAWREVPNPATHYLASLPAGSRIPADHREWVSEVWATVRAAQRDARK